MSAARGPVAPGQASLAGGAFRVTGPVVPEDPKLSPPATLRDALVWGHARLLEAARWFLDTVQIPGQHGCGKAKVRQGWMCQNPECRRVSLRNQAHHIWHREHGGGDDPDNPDHRLQELPPAADTRREGGGVSVRAGRV